MKHARSSSSFQVSILLVRRLALDAPLSDCLRAHVRWEVATRTIPPAHLARTFAAELGRFYDRREFDAPARRVHALYATRDPEQGGTFRTRLDRRLHDRACAPVAWETTRDARLTAR